MVGVLMRTKFLVLRHSFTGTRKAMMIWGLASGVAAVVGTYWVVARAGEARGDFLAIALATWLVGWVLGPLMGGGDPGVRPEHLAHLPLHHRQKAVALFGAALVGIGPVVMLAAAGTLVWYAAGLGVAAVVVSLVATVLLVLMVVALSNALVAALGAVMNTRLAAALMAVPWGILICLSAQGWVVIAAIAESGTTALPPSWSHGLRIAPSGWPLAAVEAAGRGEWALVAAALGGLVVLVALALLVWGRLLRRPATRPVIRPGLGRRWRPSGPIDAIVGKEVRTWGRDLVRVHFLSFALVYAVTYTVLPVLIGSTDFLPMTGVFGVVMAAGCSAHLHSSDGTALWQTLMKPGLERADVQGRQLAWLLVVGPPAVILTVVGALVHGEMPMVWWAAALLPVALGAGVGVMLAISVYVPIRMTDPHRRGSNPGQDGGALAGLIWLVLPVVALATAPSIVLVATGHELLGVVAGLAIGGLGAWGLGRVAYRRLAARGPELLTKVGTV